MKGLGDIDIRSQKRNNDSLAVCKTSKKPNVKGPNETHSLQVDLYKSFLDLHLFLKAKPTNLDRERLRHQVGDNRLVGSEILPGLHDSVQLPVGPEDDVLEHGQGVRVKQVVVVGDDLLSTSSVVVAEVDEVELRVGEVDPLVGDVQSEAVGPIDLGADDRRSVRSIHANALKTRELAPVGPEQPPGIRRRVQAQASRLRDILVDQDHPVVAFSCRDLDAVELGVEPVQVFGDPVVGQALDQGQAALDEHLGAVAALHLHDLLGLHVGPVDDVVDHVRGSGNHVFNSNLKLTIIDAYLLPASVTILELGLSLVAPVITMLEL